MPPVAMWLVVLVVATAVVVVAAVVIGVEGGGAVVEVVVRFAFVDVVDDPLLGLVDGVRDVEVVVDEDTDVETAGSTTTVVGGSWTGATATIDVGTTAIGLLTRSRTCDTATHDRASATVAAPTHRPANFNHCGITSVSPEMLPNPSCDG